MLKIHLSALYFIYKKETLRFLKIYHQTIFTPVVNVGLLYSVFTLAFGSKITSPEGKIHFNMIVASGLIIMSVLQNCYTNSSSSIAMSKILGHMTDYLIPPINKSEILIAHILSSFTRGVLCALAVGLSLFYFANLKIHHAFFCIFYIFVSSFIFSCLGVIFGSISNSFDKNHAYNTYFIGPLTFLSGTFYQISDLPIFWQKIIKLNPVYYMIDGFRYSVTGITSISDHFISMIYMFVSCIVIYCLALYFLKRYYKLY